jgi:prolyl oligopeptidase PreP (S9A serine peptidase family)
VVLRCLGHRGDLATTVSPKRTFLARQKSIEKCLGDSVVFRGMRSVFFIAAVLMSRTGTAAGEIREFDLETIDRGVI